jgi:EmrB/QacA subfamily drug resistance transporter
MVSKNIDPRWIAFTILCLGTVMEVLDSTIVNVALPSIRTSLHFSESNLAWVVNAYLLTFGGFLLLGGRLGDLFGRRKLFLIGITIFTLSSLGCGLAQSQAILILARAIQGFGGAIIAAVSLSLIMNLFTKPDERIRAMGYFGFIAAGGGSVGVLLGGFLTNSFDWHWNFLINVPIGIFVFIASLKILPSTRTEMKHRQLDAFGAITVTSSLLLAVYAIVNGNQVGWLSTLTVTMLGAAIVLMGLFVWVESHVTAPLMPLSLFKIRNITSANIICVLWAASMFAWFFLSALYLQLVLKYSPLQVGLTFLSPNIIMAIFSVGLSAKLVMKYGIKKPIVVGLFLAACGLGLFVIAPVHANFLFNVLPNMLLLGLGAGIAFNPILLSAMNDVKPEESGLASGLVNTSFMMGGALGLAILASIAAAQTQKLLTLHVDELTALNSGYHSAFLVGSLCALVASFLAAFLLQTTKVGSSKNK